MFEKLFRWLIAQTLNGVMGIYDATVGKLQFSKTGFMAMIPGITAVQNVILALAWLIILLNFYTGTALSVVQPISGSQRESAWRSVWRLFASAVLIMIGSRMTTILLDILSTAINWVSGTYNMQAVSTSWMSRLDVSTWEETASLVFGLGFCLMVAYEMIMAVVNFLERYVCLALYIYCYPIAMAFYSSMETEDVTKEWFWSFLKQGFALIVEIWVFALFHEKAVALADAGSNVILHFIIMIALLAIAKNSEKFLTKFGVRTMPTADTARSIGGAMAGVAMTGVSLLSGWGHRQSADRARLRMMNNGTNAPARPDASVPPARVGSVSHAAEQITAGIRSAGAGRPINPVTPKKSDSLAYGKSYFGATYQPTMQNGRLAVPENSMNRSQMRTAARTSGALGVQRGTATRTLTHGAGNMIRGNVQGFTEGYASEVATTASAVRSFNSMLEHGGHISNADTAKALNFSETLPDFTPRDDGYTRMASVEHQDGLPSHNAVMLEGRMADAHGNVADRTMLITQDRLDSGTIADGYMINTNHMHDMGAGFTAYEVSPLKGDKIPEQYISAREASIQEMRELDSIPPTAEQRSDISKRLAKVEKKTKK